MKTIHPTVSPSLVWRLATGTDDTAAASAASTLAFLGSAAHHERCRRDGMKGDSMSIARTVKGFLDSQHLNYEILQHPRTATSTQTANAAYIWRDVLVKSVLLEDDRGYVMAVLPASRRVDLATLRRALGRELRLAEEAELVELFDDCEPGAIPPLGSAYGIPVVYDDRLADLGSVYFEAGDHEDLIYVRGEDFMQLFAGAPHCAFGEPA
jgi:Ala-tRNA(Pro) deacylase